MSSASNPSVQEDGSGGRELPSFTSVRRDDSGDSSNKPGSSASGSRRSARSSLHDGPAAVQDATPDNRIQSGDGTFSRTSGTVRRSRPNSTGGFLLDTALHPRQAFLSLSRKEKPDIKGKRPREESEIIVPKRRTRDVKHEKRPSIGGSPLVTEVTQDTDLDTDPNDDALVTGTDIRKSTFLQGGNTGSPRYGSNTASSRAPPTIGYDTDPAQIVNMALTLTEKRRRYASGSRMASAQANRSRPASGNLPPQFTNALPFSTPPRSSPRPSSQSPEDKPMRGISGPHEEHKAFVGGPVILDEENSELDAPFPVSQATETRVLKARTYFELAYEHRRLLSHLPPLRRPDASPQQSESKVYNPLQYSRNRKLRFSERHPISAEAEGWHEIDQVRAWVDKVINAHTETRHDADECVRLPDFAYIRAPDPAEEDDDEEKDPMMLDSPESSVRKLSALKTAKPRRPRSDWVTHPGDLIADACWLEQGQNKLKIVDSNGNKIYPPDTRFKFSGWRNRTPIHLPDSLQQPTPPPEEPGENEMDPTSAPPALPELPIFQSNHKDKSRKHSRRKSSFKTKLGAVTREQKHAVFDGGSLASSSSADDSEDEVSMRGRRLISRKRQKDKNVNGWKPVSAIDPQTSRNYGSSVDISLDQSNNNSKRPSIDHNRLSKFFSRDSRTDSSKQHSRTRSDLGRKDSITGPPSRGSFDAGNAPRSSAEYDSTAPTSPIGTAFPSIAINLSPPVSRSPSPSKRVLPSMLNPFRDRSSSKVREGIEASDFGKMVSRQSTRNSGLETDPANDSSDPASRGTSPMTRGKSPMTRTDSKPISYHEPQYTVDDHLASTVSKMSTKSMNSDGHARVRGIFKGGRIAELVGNEVSKVGDYIWKRDIPHSVRRKGSVSSSLHSYQASDTDEEVQFQNGFAMKTPPPNDKRIASNESEAQRSKKTSPSDTRSTPDSGEKVDGRYHNPNLPSFTSPFQKDRDAQEERKRLVSSPTQPPKEQPDHISKLAAEHRSATKSPRLDRLAPPKLNVSRSVSPHAPFEVDRRSSYGFGDRDLSRSRNASQIFNEALKTNGSMVTGLTGIHPSQARSRSRIDLFRTVSHQSTGSGMAEVENVSKRDIAFTTALLMSTAVKAKEIVRRADAYRDPLPAFLLKTIDPDNETLHTPQPLKVMRKEEHVVAARNLIGRLSKEGQRFQDKLQSFQRTMLPNLHRTLQGLEDLVENELTPGVRKSGDEAGELSMKLSTTSTLAVKDVNERIDMAVRRRRRGPVRWLRRFGYLYIEWAVVALLWGIWAVVSVLRLMRGFIFFFIRAVQWLLFLD